MDTIPSSAFLAIGQTLLTPIQISIPVPLPRRSLVIIDTAFEVTTYDILNEWANLIIEYFGEYL